MTDTQKKHQELVNAYANMCAAIGEKHAQIIETKDQINDLVIKRKNIIIDIDKLKKEMQKELKAVQEPGLELNQAPPLDEVPNVG